jgi:inhibitor of KinA sporulation pathway (predicted exonuclease)
MAKKLDHVLVIDIEATCWEGGYPPKGESNDVIEIGLVPLELSTGRRLEKRSLLVRPERSTVGQFCTQLTTLTQEQVAGGILFKDACKILEEEYHSTERLWASFGDYDRRQIERQCREQGVRYPFGPSHLNAKTLSAICKGLTTEIELEGSLKLWGLPMEGTHHRGADDAWNIAAILRECLKRIKGRT